MSKAYGQFNDEKTDRSTILKEEFIPKIALDPAALKVYPSCILEKNFPDLKQEDKGNFFDFQGATISEFCKEYEQKILAKSLKDQFAKETQDSMKNVYTKLQDLFWEQFEQNQSDVEVDDENQVPKTESIEVENNVNSLVLTADNRIIYHEDNVPKVYDLLKKQEIPFFGKQKHESEIVSVKIGKDKDGSKIITCSGLEIFVWNAATGQKLQSILAKDRKDPIEFNELALSSDDSTSLRIFVGCTDGKILSYDLGNSKGNKDPLEVLKEDKDPLEGHEECVTCLEITSNGSKLISGSEDNTVRVWDLEKKKEINLFKKHLDNVSCLALTTDETKVVSGGFDGRVILWDLEAGKDISMITYEDEEILALVLFNDNNTVILASYNIISLWDMNSSKKIFSVRTDGDHNCITITKDYTKVIYGGDQTIQIWDIGSFDKKELIYQEKADPDRFGLATMTPDGQNLAAVNEKGELILWDLRTKKPKSVLKGHKEKVIVLASSNDSSKIFSGDLANVVKAWDVKNGKELYSLNLTDDNAADALVLMAISADDQNLVYWSNNFLRIWSLDNKIELGSREKSLISIAISSDFSTILGCSDETICVFDPKEFNDGEIFYLDEHDEIIDALAITPDNKKAISISKEEKLLAIWDLEKRVLIRTLALSGKFEGISINFFWPNSDQALVSVNNYLLDMNNNNYLMKYRSYAQCSKQFYCQKENFILDLTLDSEKILKVVKINQIFSYDFLVSSFALTEFFKNDEKDMDLNKDVYEGKAILYPFKFNALHVSALMKAESMFNLPLQEINVPISALLARDCFGNNCCDILVILKEKELLKKFIDLYVKSYESSSFYYKAKLFGFDYNPIKNQNIYNFIMSIMDLYGDTNFLNQFLELSYVDYNEVLYYEDVSMDELEEPLYFIGNEMKEFHSADQIKSKIEEALAGKKKALDQRKATLSCKVLSLENFVDITTDTNKFNERLSQYGVSDSVFKNKVLEMVVAYKWDQYARSIYLKDLNYFLLFFSIFLVNFLFLFPYRVDETTENFSTPEIISCILNVLSICYFIYYLIRELREVERDPKEYFLSGYNYIDIGLIITAFIVLIIDLLNILAITNDSNLVKLFASITAFLFWLRVISYLRGFEGTAFMIRLIFEVVSDIRYFLLLILMFTLSFNCSIYLIQSSYDTENDSTSDTLYNMFTLCYRLVLGDYTNYDNLSVQYSFYLWLMMVIFTMLLTVILLNLLISIIGKSFDIVWESKSSTRTYELLNIMSSNGGIDSRLSPEEIQKMRDEKKIGKYLLCFYNNKNEEINIEQGEVNKKVLENNKEFSDKLQQIENTINSNATDVETKMEKLQNELTSNSAKMLKMNKNIREILNLLKAQDEKKK